LLCGETKLKAGDIISVVEVESSIYHEYREILKIKTMEYSKLLNISVCGVKFELHIRKDNNW
jgi:hypothetical protein